MKESANATPDSGAPAPDVPYKEPQTLSKGVNPRIVASATAAVLLVALALTGSIVSLGQQLGAANFALGVLFYLLCGVCVVVGAVVPIARTLSRPVFGLDCLERGNTRQQRRKLQFLVDNLLKRARIPCKERDAIARITNPSPAELADLYVRVLEPVVDADIKRAAKASFVSTAISQAPAFDMLSVAAVNLRLVRSIATDCGFRPSGPTLWGLYARVMKATLFAGGIEQMDLEEVIALAGGNTLIGASGMVLSSAAQGASNAFLTVRVGVIAKKLLLSKDAPADMRELRRSSYGEALEFLRTCGLLDDLRAAVASVAASMRDAAKEKVAEAGKAAREKAAETLDATRDSVGRTVRSGTERVGDMLDAVKDGVEDASTAMRDAAARTIPKRQTGFFQHLRKH